MHLKISKWKNNMKKAITPIGIKLISIYYWFISFLYLSIAIGVIFKPDISINNGSMMRLPIVFALIFSGILIIISIIHVFLGIGIWKKNNFAKWVIVLISATSIVLSIIGSINIPEFEVILPNLILLIISGTIIYFLLFSKTSKRHFR